MKLTLDPKTFAISIERDGIEWHTLESFEPTIVYGGSACVYGVKDITETVRFADAKNITVENADTGVGKGMRATLSGFSGPAEGLAFELYAWVEDSTEAVRCEFIPLQEGKEAPTAIYWPGPMAFEEGSKKYVTLVNEEQGWLVPNDHPVEFTKLSFAGFMGTAGAFMPWFAQIKEGHGLLTICETPWNAACDIDHPANGPYTHMSMHWEASLGKIEYRRIVRMDLVDGDHNDICKAYRAYAFEKGRLVTLKQKAILNPSVDDLTGCAWVHTGIKTMVQPNSSFFDPEAPEKNNHLTPFAEREKLVKELYDLGVEKMYLHLDGWAQPGYDNQHPDYFPICEEAGGRDAMKSLADTMHDLGYMFGIHDQYRDFYEAAKSFDEDLACRLTDGSIPRHARWAGGPQSYLCGSQTPYFVSRNFDKLEEEGIEIDGAYLDVFTCNEGDECDNPRHRMTRRDCYDYRQQCFRILLSRNILPSSEEVNDWAMPSLVFCHYAPYNFQLAEPGTPKKGIPVPLFNLVYHDCVVEPWMMDRVSEDEDYMLYALQNGGAPYLIRDAAYPNIDGAFAGEGITLEEAIERCKIVQDLHERVAQEEMLRVELLNDEGTKQRVIFAGGTVVTIDFKEQSYIIDAEC